MASTVAWARAWRGRRRGFVVGIMRIGAPWGVGVSGPVCGSRRTACSRSWVGPGPEDFRPECRTKPQDCETAPGRARRLGRVRCLKPHDFSRLLEMRRRPAGALKKCLISDRHARPGRQCGVVRGARTGRPGRSRRRCRPGCPLAGGCRSALRRRTAAGRWRPRCSRLWCTTPTRRPSGRVLERLARTREDRGGQPEAAAGWRARPRRRGRAPCTRTGRDRTAPRRCSPRAVACPCGAAWTAGRT